MSNPRNPYYSGTPGDHFDGTRFFNPEGREPGGFTALLRWQFGGGRVRWQAEVRSPFPPAVPDAAVAGLRVTMVNHATLLLQAPGLNLLTDPVWSKRVSPFSFAGPARHNEPGIRFADLPEIGSVLLSHNHYDHLDLATLALLKAAHDPLVVTPLGNDRIVATHVPDMRIAARDWNETVELGAGWRVHLVPVHHWSARGGFDRRMALWSGFVLDGPAGRIFFAGDTGFDGGRPYRLLAERFPGLRLALLPIGAYEPRWFMAPQHQNPEEAVEGFRLSGAAFAAGMHWGTFQLTNEGPSDPETALFQALDAAGIARTRFRALRPGESWDVPEAPVLSDASSETRPGDAS